MQAMNKTRSAIHSGADLRLAARTVFDDAAAVAQRRLSEREPVPAVTRVLS
jgi:hypothetical protein